MVKPSALTVEQFFAEWLTAVKHSLKGSAFANYQKNTEAYIVPALGSRRIESKRAVHAWHVLHCSTAWYEKIAR